MKCIDCKWWKEVGLVDEDRPDGGIEGFCCKYTPKIVRGMLFQAPDMGGEIDWTKQEFPACWENLEGVWPKTLDFKWCGEWEEKTQKE